MQEKQISEQKLRELIQSREGQKLLQVLNRHGGETLRQAVSAAQAGNYQAAPQALRPIMETKEGAAAMRDLQNRHG